METITTAQQVNRFKAEFENHNAKSEAFYDAASMVSEKMADNVHQYFASIERKDDKAAANLLWQIRAQDEIREKLLDRADFETETSQDAHADWVEYEKMFEDEQRARVMGRPTEPTE